jgi:SAM-dependent methyltransferase
VRRSLYRIYWKLEAVLTPGLTFSQEKFAEVLRAELTNNHPDLLDIGSGRRLLPEWMNKQEAEILSLPTHITGLDLDMDSLRDHTAYPDKVMASCYALPFASGSFDVACANMVVEHLDQPAKLLAELRRVLRPGGRFVFHTPNLRSPILRIISAVPDRVKIPFIRLLEGRKSKDVFPTHYCFNRSQDIERLAGQTGFRVASLNMISSSAFTSVLGPLSVFELVWLRFISRPSLAKWRTNLIVVLKLENQ